MTLASPLTEALQDRFEFERELGRGGMATVYLAHDRKLDRVVALKVLRPGLAAVLGPERFLQEIRFTARLQHPHILPVFDAGEANGQLWYTMPFVDGESLRERLRRDGPLSTPEALRIAREVAEALDHSHRHGVIHRDIKPDNILLEEGYAVVADFGIARALSGVTEATPATTEARVVLGSPAYMSPEQAMGEATVDGRTDIYALGCVLYEMLAGVPPLMAPTPQAILARRLSERAPPLSMGLEPVAPELDAVIARALAPRQTDRFTTAAEFAAALTPAALEAARRTLMRNSTWGWLRAAVEVALQRARGPPRALITLLIGLGLPLAAGLIFIGGSWFTDVPTGRTAARRSLAVLPFESIGDTAGKPFADGMSEELSARLGRVAGLELVSRSSAQQYRRSSQTALSSVGRWGSSTCWTVRCEWPSARRELARSGSPRNSSG